MPAASKGATVEATPKDPNIGNFDYDLLKVGQTVKVLNDEGNLKRERVIELDEYYKKEVKVKLCGSKKKAEWKPVAKVRLIKQNFVDWEDLDRLLPVEQDPESRKTRKDVFKRWDASGNGTLSLSEIQYGVPSLLGEEIGADVEEIKAAVKSAYNVARNLSPPKKAKKGKENKDAKLIDSKEWHAFLVAFRHYVQLAELFEQVDNSNEDDQKLSCRECMKFLDKLKEWGITEDDVEEKFKGKDKWTPCLKFPDFCKWCIEERWKSMPTELELDSSDEEVEMQEATACLREEAGISKEEWKKQVENRAKVRKIFEQWDSDGSGTISEDELLRVICKLDPKVDEAKARDMFKKADANSDGVLDIDEFCFWLFRKS